MKKIYLIPETKICISKLHVYMLDGSSPQIDNEDEAEVIGGDDGDALGKERGVGSNEIW